MIEDPIVYCDRPDFRVLNLRADGITCLAAVGMSALSKSRKEPELHIHPNVMEFCLCIKGNLTFETDERDYRFLPGQIFVSSPKEPHRLKNNPKGLKIYRMLFRIPRIGESFLGLHKRESEWLARSLMNLPKRVFLATPGIRAAFERIFDLYDNARRSPARRVRIKAAVLDLLVSIVDAARRLPQKVPEKIDGIAKRIRESPEGDYDVMELAKGMGLSRSAFADLFKKSIGLPLHAYVIESRVIRAKQLLVRTSRTIGEIADEMRFSSVPHFTTMFRRIIGTTPHAIRMESRQRAAPGRGLSPS